LTGTGQYNLNTFSDHKKVEGLAQAKVQKEESDEYSDNYEDDDFESYDEEEEETAMSTGGTIDQPKLAT
jgi:hypothetical protein